MEEAELALDRVLALPFPRMPFGEIAGEALRAGRATSSITVYDACYVALAATTGLPLVTADRRMARAARAVGCGLLHGGGDLMLSRRRRLRTRRRRDGRSGARSRTRTVDPLLTMEVLCRLS